MQSFFALSSRISLKPIVRSPVTTRNATGAFPQPVTGSTALIAQPPTKTLTTSQTAVGVAAVAVLCLLAIAAAPFLDRLLRWLASLTLKSNVEMPRLSPRPQCSARA